MQTNNKELFNPKVFECCKCEDGDGTGERNPAKKGPWRVQP